MRHVFKLCIAAIWLAAVAAGQVKITELEDRITVDIDGKPFTALFIGQDVAKPYLWPLRAVSGTSVTRSFPLEDAPGDSQDHPHHRGLTFAHANVNGFEYWANEPFNGSKKKGRISVRKVLRAKGGSKEGVIQAVMSWLDPDGRELMTDTRKITFYSHPTLRVVDFDIQLRAVETVKFGDTHEGSFGVRVAAFLEEPDPDYVPLANKGDVRPTEPRRTGLISNSTGARGEKEVRGKRAGWGDYSGEFKGEKLGVAILDHPSNPRHPTYWHTRGYGIFAANIFGVSVFENNKNLDGSLTLQPGEDLRLRYRVIVHPGDAKTAGIGKLYEEYSR